VWPHDFETRLSISVVRIGQSVDKVVRKDSGMRWAFIALIYVGAILVTLAARNAWVAKSAAPTAKDEIPTSNSRRQALRIFADGIVEGTHPEVSPRFEIAGRIRKVLVHENETVAAGYVLAELESDVGELRLSEARTRLAIATAERDELVAETKQAAKDRRVQQAGGEAKGRDYGAKIDAARLAIADSRIALAEAAIQQEELLLEKTRLRSPIDGVVLRAVPEPGEFTGPTDSRELFTIANHATTRVRAYVEELDALRVKPGLRAVVTCVGEPGREYPGQIISCAPAVRPKVSRHLKPGEFVDVRVREIVIELDNGSELLLGLPVEVFIDRDARNK
jgi:multidrug efflux pump subunit AcrA (membrane-fusion protein)